MHEEKLIDSMGGADVDEGVGQIGGSGVGVLKDDDSVVATVRAEETQQQLGVLFGCPVDCCHGPAGQA